MLPPLAAFLMLPPLSAFLMPPLSLRFSCPPSLRVSHASPLSAFLLARLTSTHSNSHRSAQPADRRTSVLLEAAAPCQLASRPRPRPSPSFLLLPERGTNRRLHGSVFLRETEYTGYGEQPCSLAYASHNP